VPVFSLLAVVAWLPSYERLDVSGEAGQMESVVQHDESVKWT
jgi:hypothetical protein